VAFGPGPERAYPVKYASFSEMKCNQSTLRAYIKLLCPTDGRELIQARSTQVTSRWKKMVQNFFLICLLAGREKSYYHLKIRQKGRTVYDFFVRSTGY
jgi:hypothetical protein